MNQTSTTARTKRVLTIAVMATLWLAGAGGGFAADAPVAATNKPDAAADVTVVLDDTTLWRLFRVEGATHVRGADGSQSRRLEDTVVASGHLTEAFSSPLPPTGWVGPTFDDSAWPRVLLPQPMLYNPPYPSDYPYDTLVVLARGKFEVKDPAQVKSCGLSLEYWGGVVVYVNGKEAARGHLPGNAPNLKAVAEDYPEEAFIGPDGKPLVAASEYPKEEAKEEVRKRLALRDRRLQEVAIPAPRFCVRGSMFWLLRPMPPRSMPRCLRKAALFKPGRPSGC